MRELRSGESYGIQNSLSIHFGLGQVVLLDSLKVLWPSGGRSTYFNIDANQKLLLEEGRCITPRINLQYPSEIRLCDGDSIVLSASNGIDYHWNNGDTSASIVVKESGIYCVRFRDDLMGCMYHSNAVQINYNPDEQANLVLSPDDSVICEGDTFLLTIDQPYPVSWSNNKINDTLVITKSGRYSGRYEGVCQSYNTDSIDLVFYTIPDPPTIENDTLLGASFDTLIVEGGINTSWFKNVYSVNPIAEGDTLFTGYLKADTSFYVQNNSVYPRKVRHVGQESVMASGGKLHVDHLSFKMIFNAFSDFTLHSFDVYTDRPGLRNFIVENPSGVVINRKNIFLDTGLNRVVLNLLIPETVGDYKIYTDENVNLLELGMISPGLFRSDENTFYPYEIPGVMRIKNSSKGPDAYYYFYNWIISPMSLFCASERKRVDVIVDTTTNLSNLSTSRLIISPNPVIERLKILGRGEERNAQMSILGIDGRVIYRTSKSSFKYPLILDASMWNSGVYHILILTPSALLHETFIKM